MTPFRTRLENETTKYTSKGGEKITVALLKKNASKRVFSRQIGFRKRLFNIFGHWRVITTLEKYWVLLAPPAKKKSRRRQSDSPFRYISHPNHRCLAKIFLKSGSISAFLRIAPFIRADFKNGFCRSSEAKRPLRKGSLCLEKAKLVYMCTLTAPHH